ncbi:HAMP domain-containing sensor histidine kinase [Kitasatospora sp. MBT63]|uniref:HAMP domain-containing sensor histidine kinase n=1 Tax=Kitasatospora sp. MBT63 TaxID=1444768 RepID=UPI0009E7D30B|nr:HAMP domain-containing sensor histidine kinase [Kitasatospora sp. MBT63]
MRRSLAGVAFAVTSMVALSFLIPLAFLLQSQAKTQSRTAAEQRAAALAPFLTVEPTIAELSQAVSDLDSDNRLGVHLPDGRIVGASHSSAESLARAADRGESLTEDVHGGWVYLQPIVLAHNQVAVIESFVPQAEMSRGVGTSWAVMTLTAGGLVIGSVALSDRLGARVVRSSKRFARASHALGSGDLRTRIEPSGPPELYEAGLAFNAMADRMVELLAIERELVADLSHRLRTPLAALQLATERLGPTDDAERIRCAISQLESELNSIITTARTPLATGPMGAAFRDTPPGRLPHQHTDADLGEVADVVRRRAAFWAILASQQNRRCDVSITTEATPVALPEDDLAAVLDAMVGNVFRHTPQECALAISVERTAQAVTIAVEDAGPGIIDPDRALARGSSAGSTGLGLDIARRAATATGGEVTIGRSPLGGARVAVRLGLSSTPSLGSRIRHRAALRQARPCCRLTRQRGLRVLCRVRRRGTENAGG